MTDDPVSKQGRRPRRRLVLMAALPLLLALAGAWAWLASGRYEETENANLRLTRLTIASEIAGRVASSAVADNAVVHRGDVLFALDPEPLRIALAQADAAVDGARLTVRQLRAGREQAIAQLRIAEDNARYRHEALTREEALAAKGVVTASDLDDARHVAATADQQVAAAEQAVKTAEAALGTAIDGDLDLHPTVAAALAARARAAYSLSVATVTAPADGILYQAATFGPGVYVTPGAALFTLVETGAPWIDANFKETQLSHVAPGQTADVVFDFYPGRHYPATVDSILADFHSLSATDLASVNDFSTASTLALAAAVSERARPKSKSRTFSWMR